MSAVVRILIDDDCPRCGWPEQVAVGQIDVGPDHLECGRREPCGWRHDPTEAKAS